MTITVLMAGLAATAGSPPNRLTKIGKAALITVDDITCKESASDIKNAINDTEYSMSISISQLRNKIFPNAIIQIHCAAIKLTVY